MTEKVKQGSLQAENSPVDLLVMQAENLDDSETQVYSGELFLLRKVFESASDFERSKNWPDFAEHYSVEETGKCLFDAIEALKRYLEGFE